LAVKEGISSPTETISGSRSRPIFPLYSIIVIGAYGTLLVFQRATDGRLLYGLIGADGPSLHLTCWMIPKKRRTSPITAHFFRGDLLMNLLLLSVMLVLASSETFADLGLIAGEYWKFRALGDDAWFVTQAFSFLSGGLSARRFTAQTNGCVTTPVMRLCYSYVRVSGKGQICHASTPSSPPHPHQVRGR
jgi:hypothetical protein